MLFRSTESDPVAAAKARSYAKRITNDIKTFVEATIKESENLPLSKPKEVSIKETKNESVSEPNKLESALDVNTIKVDSDSSKRKAF